MLTPAMLLLLLSVLLSVLVSPASALAPPPLSRSSPRAEESADGLYLHHCANHQEHTLDRYPREGAAPACGTVTRRGVTDTERDEIVTAHNGVRDAVSAGQYREQRLPPAAPPLAALRWDQQLAEAAQRWADQCLGGHDHCRDVARFAVGQNQAWVWGGRGGCAVNWTREALRQWFHDELPLFQQSDLVFRGGQDPVSGGFTGHLTQILWADTAHIGCGFIAVADPLYRERRTYVCNYGPAGNVLTQHVYPADWGRDDTRR